MELRDVDVPILCGVCDHEHASARRECGICQCQQLVIAGAERERLLDRKLAEVTEFGGKPTMLDAHHVDSITRTFDHMERLIDSDGEWDLKARLGLIMLGKFGNVRGTSAAMQEILMPPLMLPDALWYSTESANPAEALAELADNAVQSPSLLEMMIRTRLYPDPDVLAARKVGFWFYSEGYRKDPSTSEKSAQEDPSLRLDEVRWVIGADVDGRIYNVFRLRNDGFRANEVVYPAEMQRQVKEATARTGVELGPPRIATALQSLAHSLRGFTTGS